MLSVEQLNKTYTPGIIVLKDINFALTPHTFTAVLGTSGAGKTTLLRCILQLTPVKSGHVWFGGQDLTTCSAKELRQARTHIAFIAQHFNLVRRRSALENCLAGRLQELPLWRCLLGVYPHSLLHEGLAALEQVQLLRMAFQRADRLSGGQQQRVAIARALVQHASLLLADEPVASLDPETAQIVLNLLQSLCQQGQLTVVCNLHQVELALEYSDRILGIKSGQLVLDKPTKEVRAADIELIYQQ